MGRNGFTLVELMIVVAIIGILASISIPAFQEMQLRAKKAEMLVNVSGLADVVRLAVADGAVPAGSVSTLHPRPAGVDKQAVAWTSPGDPVWALVDWAPDGAVRCNYQFHHYPAGDHWRSVGYCDLDDDGTEWGGYEGMIGTSLEMGWACSGGSPMGTGTLDSGSNCF